MTLAERVGSQILEGKSVGFMDRVFYALGSLVIYGPIKNNLGFNHIKVAYTGGAPISDEVFSFYRSIGVNLKQIYTQTESSGYAFLQPNENVLPNSVGPAGPEVEFKVDKKGEIIYRSPGNFMGYYNNNKEILVITSRRTNQEIIYILKKELNSISTLWFGEGKNPYEFALYNSSYFIIF